MAMDMKEQICRKCDRLIAPETRVCTCGAPTDQASFKERAEYEVTQWRAYKQDRAHEAV